MTSSMVARAVFQGFRRQSLPGSLAITRGFAALPPTEAPLSDMREYLVATIAENKDHFAHVERIQQEGMSKDDWVRLCRFSCPGMHAATMNSLFVTMDRDQKGIIRPSELFSDRILRILQTRFNTVKTVHPLEGAYICLPQPPFHADAAQEACIERLKVVWDGVVEDWRTSGLAAPHEEEVEESKSSAPLGLL